MRLSERQTYRAQDASTIYRKHLIDVFLKEYYFEHETKDRISSSLSLNMTAISAMFAAFFFIFSHLYSQFLSKGNVGVIDFFAISFLFSSLVLGLCSVYYFVRAAYGYEYRYLPQADGWSSYLREISKFQMFSSPTKKWENLLDKFDTQFYEYLCECNEKNRWQNKTKSGRRHKSLLFLSLSLTFLLFGSILLLIELPDFHVFLHEFMSSAAKLGCAFLAKFSNDLISICKSSTIFCCVEFVA